VSERDPGQPNVQNVTSFRRYGTQEVAGSSPASSIAICREFPRRLARAAFLLATDFAFLETSVTILVRRMTVGIVGRDEELASLRAFVDEAREAPAALVLEGEPGIGKSTLWLASVEHARARGLRVLSCRPAEAERSLVHVGLGDLLAGVLDDVLPALPAPRRRALEVALLLDEAAEDAVDPRALALATRGALQLLAEDGPILVAIDDLQWFDASSERALAFALRRLHRQRRAPAACPAAR
jgi:AAA ATPase domain